MSFRIGDTLVFLDSGITQAERNVLAPGKQYTTGQLIICNPKLAACQRAAGLDPTTDTSYFNCSLDLRLDDIFDYDCSFVDTMLSCKSFCMGKGSDFVFCKTKSDYGTYVVPTCDTFHDSGGNQLTFNDTSVHYSLTASLSLLSGNEYQILLDHNPASIPHNICRGCPEFGSGIGITPSPNPSMVII